MNIEIQTWPVRRGERGNRTYDKIYLINIASNENSGISSAKLSDSRFPTEEDLYRFINEPDPFCRYVEGDTIGFFFDEEIRNQLLNATDLILSKFKKLLSLEVGSSLEFEV